MVDAKHNKDQFAQELKQQLASAASAAKAPLSRDEVSAIIAEVLQSLSGDLSIADLKLYSELEQLAQYIRKARNEIAALKPDAISQDLVPSATDELDAVVGATEDATNRIMDNCDRISALAERINDEGLKNEILAINTSIFEACSFQDITGQRITKVVRTLKHIDAQIESLLRAFGGESLGTQVVGEDKNFGAPESARAEEVDLLNGPQLPGNAIDQSEIDRLLAEMDGK